MPVAGATNPEGRERSSHARSDSETERLCERRRPDCSIQEPQSDALSKTNDAKQNCRSDKRYAGQCLETRGVTSLPSMRTEKPGGSLAGLFMTSNDRSQARVAEISVEVRSAWL